MNTPLLNLCLLLAFGLAACHKQTAQAEMDAESRQKAIEVRAAADKETAAINQSAALDHAKAITPAATPASSK